MDTNGARSADEQIFWASTALELLGKAALARVSPLLIAEPNVDGFNLLIAAGLVEGKARFKSVSASTIFKRCEKVFRPFSATEAIKASYIRNEYLHGASLDFMPFDLESWWPRYWALAVILITAQDRSIEDLVGADRDSIVESYLERNLKNIEERTEALVARARQRFSLLMAGTLSSRELASWRSPISLSAGLRYSATETCPACGSPGKIEGDDYINYEFNAEQDDNFDDSSWSFWADITVPSDYFSCPECRLVLDRSELIMQAGLPETFMVIDDDPPQPDPDYGND
jgi:hypothetical protein